MRRAPLILGCCLAAACVSGDVTPGAAADTPADPDEEVPADPHAEEVARWHEARLEALRADRGWLTLVGLHWLEAEENTVGSADESAVILPPSAPERAGVLHVRSEGAFPATFKPAPGVQVDSDGGTLRDLSFGLRSDEDGAPSVVTLGSVSFSVIRRGDRLAVRVWDTEATARTTFTGIERFPVSAAWRIQARWEPYDPPRTVRIPTVVPGFEDEGRVPGAAVFEVDGETQRLEPTEAGDGLFFVFADATSRHETYGGGRFLYADAPADGHVILDFNRAYNPPCALTPHATCPLPRPENRLPVRVTAGEMGPGR